MAMMAHSLSVTSRKVLADRDVFSAFWPHTESGLGRDVPVTDWWLQNERVQGRLFASFKHRFLTNTTKYRRRTSFCWVFVVLVLVGLVCFVFDCLFFQTFVPPLLSIGMWPAVFLHVLLRPQATCGLLGTGNGVGGRSGWEGWRGRVPMNSSSLRSDPSRPKRPSATATTRTLRRRGPRQCQATCCFRNKVTKDSLRTATVEEQMSIPNSSSPTVHPQQFIPNSSSPTVHPQQFIEL